MENPQSTCWTVIRGAVDRRETALQEFGSRYVPVLEAYFGARWGCARSSERVQDSVQEVFLELLRHGGGLERFDQTQPNGFRPYLYGIARNVASRFEGRVRRERVRHVCEAPELDLIAADEESLSLQFDRDWARLMLREARALLEERASRGDQRLVEQLELLRLHFEQGLKIRDIARQRGLEDRVLYRRMNRARTAFRSALLEVLAFHHPGAPHHAEAECERLLASLG